MNQRKAYALARETMNEHGLNDWSFKFDSATKRLGCCYQNLKRIQLSSTFVALNNELKVYDVILHEIAHALTPRQGHNQVWKAKAREIGCSEQKSTTNAVQPPAKYITSCPNKHEGKANRRPRRGQRSCGRCSPLFSPHFLITYKLNPEYKKAFGDR